MWAAVIALAPNPKTDPRNRALSPSILVADRIPYAPSVASTPCALEFGALSAFGRT